MFMEAYRFRLSKLPLRRGGLLDVGELRRGVDALGAPGLQVAQERRQRDLRLVQDEVVHLREVLVLGDEERPARHHRHSGRAAALRSPHAPRTAGRSWR